MLNDAYPRIFQIALNKNAMVAEVFSRGPSGLNWSLPFSHDPYK